jgi:SAM-dependent methyltransferase
MTATEKKTFPYTWEEAIEVLRNDPAHRQLIHDAYLGPDLFENSRRFAASSEFAATRALLAELAPKARRVLDMPGGNGLATHAFAAAGYDVTSVEPNPSDSVGRGAIRRVLDAAGLDARIVDAWGESLPFPDGAFDVAYVRQGLHHASDLKKMVAELARVLVPGGLLLACREHVVDNYGESLEAFLASQVDHQLYGGEHAFTLTDYRAAIDAAPLSRVRELGPFESIINAYPNTPEVLREKILRSPQGRLLGKVLPAAAVAAIGLWRVRRRKTPGRLYTFVAVKAKASPRAQ